jgi:hypothetical protein
VEIVFSINWSRNFQTESKDNRSIIVNIPCPVRNHLKLDELRINEAYLSLPPLSRPPACSIIITATFHWSYICMCTRPRNCFCSARLYNKKIGRKLSRMLLCSRECLLELKHTHKRAGMHTWNAHSPLNWKMKLNSSWATGCDDDVDDPVSHFFGRRAGFLRHFWETS